MGQSIAEKILSKMVGHKVYPGEIIWVEPDLITCPEISVERHLQELVNLNVNEIWDLDKFFLVVDHRVIVDDEAFANMNKRMRSLVDRFKIRHFYDIGRHGIGHQLPVELGYITPGMLVIGGDTHVPTLGAMGALAVAINAELPTVLATGKIWLKVPESIKVNLKGKLSPGLTSRDIAQYVITKVGSLNGDYRMLEFTGDGVEYLDVDQRMTICNIATEIGVKSAIFNPDKIITDYLKLRASKEYEMITSDIDAKYVQEYEVDLSKIEPQVAVPPNPEVSVSVNEVQGKKIDWAFIGSCASGRMEDLRVAAKILEGRKVHSSVKMVIVPSSQEIYLRAVQEGLIEIFIKANTMVAPPTCGPCYGSIVHLSDGEVCIGTGTRNEPGRIGSQFSELFLASPATVAASAICGEITNPLIFNREEVN